MVGSTFLSLLFGRIGTRDPIHPTPSFSSEMAAPNTPSSTIYPFRTRDAGSEGLVSRPPSSTSRRPSLFKFVRGGGDRSHRRRETSDTEVGRGQGGRGPIGVREEGDREVCSRLPRKDDNEYRPDGMVPSNRRVERWGGVTDTLVKGSNLRQTKFMSLPEDKRTNLRLTKWTETSPTPTPLQISSNKGLYYQCPPGLFVSVFLSRRPDTT